MQLNSYNLTRDGGVTSQESSEMTPEWFTDDVVRWVDVIASNTEEIEQLLDPLDLDERVEAAAAKTEARPEVIAFEEVIFLRIPFLGQDGEHHSLRLICGPTAIVSTRTAPMPEIGELARTLQSGARKVKPSVADLLIEILEAILRETRPVGLALREEVNELSDTLESEDSDITVADLLALKRRTTELACLVEDQLICLGGLMAARSDALSLTSVRGDIRTIIEVLEKVRPIALRLEEQVRELRHAYASMLQEATNRRLNMLAILSAIYLPATLIAGIFGMNFTDIPITQVPHGYFYVIVFMAVLVIGQLAFFWRRGWFK